MFLLTLFVVLVLVLVLLVVLVFVLIDADAVVTGGVSLDDVPCSWVIAFVFVFYYQQTLLFIYSWGEPIGSSIFCLVRYQYSLLPFGKWSSSTLLQQQ